MRNESGKEAFGAPGIEPRWTHGNKNGVGTAYSASSRIWFTLFGGIVTEVYYPMVDRPQLRDLQYLVTDGKNFVHEEKRDLQAKVELHSSHTLGFRCTNSDPDGRYSIGKEVITDPHLPVLLQRTRLTGPDEAFLNNLKMFMLCAPHLEVGGYGNTGYVTIVNGWRILMACKHGVWLAMLATVPFSRTSCGYVGKSDGWTDLRENFRMDYEFKNADNGNIALTGELDLSKTGNLGSQWHSDTMNTVRLPICFSPYVFRLTNISRITRSSGTVWGPIADRCRVHRMTRATCSKAVIVCCSRTRTNRTLAL